MLWGIGSLADTGGTVHPRVNQLEIVEVTLEQPFNMQTIQSKAYNPTPLFLGALKL